MITFAILHITMRISFLLTTALFFSLLRGYGQLCTGSLGDPVVHITFGAGGTNGNALPPTTSYLYQTSDCPPDGSYTVRNSTSGCFGSTWHNVYEDHTPNDTNGHMMIVNASYQPGVFYLDTVRGLCANTTYEFAAWIMNVLTTTACGGAGIDPILVFQIETVTGQVLATYVTGNIMETVTPTWKQYGVFFTTTATSTAVVVRLSNNAPGGCGNDLLLDDITFRPCGPLVNASLTVSGDTTAELCYGVPTAYTLQSSSTSGYDDPVYQWQVSLNGGNWRDIPGATGDEYIRTPTIPGQYRYRMSIAESVNASSSSCRVASNMVTITVNGLPEPGLIDTTSGCENTLLQMDATGGLTYAWTGPNGFTADQKNFTLSNLQPADAGLYRVLVTTDKGCSASDSTNVVVHPAVHAQIVGGTSVCEDVPVRLQASGGTRYEWSPPAGLSSTSIASPIVTAPDTTQYQVKVFSEFGCVDTAYATINIWKKPRANAGPNKQMIEGNSVTLEGMAGGTQVRYFWTPPDYLNNAHLLTPVASPVSDTYYTLHVVSDLGCGSHTDEMFVRVFKEVKVPNAFSPNGDGINDDWKIQNLATYPDATLQVFNRNGQLVFTSRGYGRPWNGTFNNRPLPTGTYYYIIDLKTELFPKLSGWVFIAR